MLVLDLASIFISLYFSSQKHGPKMLDHDGKEVPGNRGYKYFGAARDLPGVRELFRKKRNSIINNN